MFSIVTVASSTRMPTASARPPSVMMLMVWRGAQHADRDENRERNRDRDDQRAAPASQEDQDHEAGEAGRDDRLPNHPVDGGADEYRLIRQRLHLQIFGGTVAAIRGSSLARPSPRPAWRRRRSSDIEISDAAPAVQSDDIGLRRKTVATRGHVADVDRRAVRQLDREDLELLHGLRTGRSNPRRIRTARSSPFPTAGSGFARRWRSPRPRAKGLACSSAGFEIHHDLALLAAIGKRNRAPGTVTSRVRMKFTP